MSPSVGLDVQSRRGDDSGSEMMNDYEQQRTARIARNKQVLIDMGLRDAVERMALVEAASKVHRRAMCRLERQERRQKRLAEPFCAPSRSSLRLRGQSPVVAPKNQDQYALSL
jgi:hypothetical protein